MRWANIRDAKVTFAYGSITTDADLAARFLLRACDLPRSISLRDPFDEATR